MAAAQRNEGMIAGIAFISGILLYAYSLHLDAKKTEEETRNNAKPIGWID